MADPGGEPHWRSAVDVPLIVLATATVLSLIRSIDQPSFSLAVGGTEVTFVLTDAALVVLAGFCLHRLLVPHGSVPRPARAVTVAAAAFSFWLVLSSAANGAEAMTAAVKLLEYGVLALGFVLFVRRPLQLWLLLGVLVAFTVVAVGYGLLAFVDAPFVESSFPARRQPSFLGEHDLAALSTMMLAVGLAALFTPATVSVACRWWPESPGRSASFSAPRWPDCSGCTSRSGRSSRLPSRGAWPRSGPSRSPRPRRSHHRRRPDASLG